MQQYADIYCKATKVLKTVNTASATGHNIGTATSLQRGLIPISSLDT